MLDRTQKPRKTPEIQCRLDLTASAMQVKIRAEISVTEEMGRKGQPEPQNTQGVVATQGSKQSETTKITDLFTIRET